LVISNFNNYEKQQQITNLCQFWKFNVATKKDLYPLPIIDPILNITRRHGVYSFLDGYLRYHQISIALED
jgi:hypothetical protein